MRITIIATLGLISSWAGLGQEKRPGTPYTASFSGAEMFQSMCATCHGASAKGNGPAASALKKTPADLTQLSKRNGGKFPTDRVRRFIDGTGSDHLPGDDAGDLS